MEMYEEILLEYLHKNGVKKFLNSSPESIVNNRCYKILKEIKEVIEDCEIDDSECFMKIEDIIRSFERAGIKCGSRHEFWLSYIE